jgi:predicted Zn-dependent protease
MSGRGAGRKQFWVRAWLVAALAAGAAGCARDPITGQRRLTLVSEAQEIEMGRQAAVDVAQSIGLVPEEGLQTYMQAIGAALAAGSHRPALPWTFRVVDDPTPNAFALPGGFIFFTRGLLAILDSEAQLGAVLGHEIGHVTARHHVQMITRAQLAQLGLGVGMILVPELQPLGGVATAGLQLLFLRYSREAERQADDLGFAYALAQQHDVREMPLIFESLRRVGEAAGQSPLPSWLLTHPAPEERIEAARTRAAELGDMPGLRRGREAYLSRLEGLVYGVNPRHGVFEGNVFLHPDLRFRLDFPRGWRTQNLPQVVAAGSPQQDAAVQLTLAQGSAAQAAQQFVAHQGIRSPGARRETINGLPGVSLTFEANTQQGVLAGLALFVEYDGRTYQMLGVTPVNRFQAYLPVFQAALGSFQPLTDPRILALQPNRLRLVRIEEAMTLAQFHQRFPSAVPIEELAIINQVAGATSTLPAGSFVKRVAP